MDRETDFDSEMVEIKFKRSHMRTYGMDYVANVIRQVALLDDFSKRIVANYCLTGRVSRDVAGLIHALSSHHLEAESEPETFLVCGDREVPVMRDRERGGFFARPASRNRTIVRGNSVEDLKYNMALRDWEVKLIALNTRKKRMEEALRFSGLRPDSLANIVQNNEYLNLSRAKLTDLLKILKRDLSAHFKQRPGR